MSKNDCLIVIPARYGSTRFPGKVLALLKGKPVIEWCWRAAQAAQLGPVVVATEDQIVLRAVESFGGKAVMTSSACVSGTDRVYQAAKSFKTPFVINLQGDEPFIQTKTLRAVAQILRGNSGADMATAVTPLSDSKLIQDPNIVKAAVAGNGRSLYFSRSPIPFPRNKVSRPYYQHIGIYGFRRAALKRFVGLAPSPLERTESLEQLRALEDGMSIFAAVVNDKTIAIDTPGDLRRASKLAGKKT